MAHRYLGESSSLGVGLGANDRLNDEAVGMQLFIGVVQFVYVEVNRHGKCVVLASFSRRPRRFYFSLK